MMGTATVNPTGQDRGTLHFMTTWTPMSCKTVKEIYTGPTWINQQDPNED